MPEDRPSLAAAIRLSVTGLIESLHAYLAWNVVLVIAAAATVLLVAVTPLALLVVPLLSPLACGLVRLATVTTRGDHVALRTALPGIRHRFGTKVGLAAGQTLVLLLAALNLLLAPAIGGIIGALSAATSVYLAGFALAYALVGWTLLCDPRREERPVRDLARLTLVIVIRRPLQVLFLLLLLVLTALVVWNLVVPALFLPSMVVLLIAGYVLPAADALVPVADA